MFIKGSIATLIFFSILTTLPVIHAKPLSISHDNLDIKIGQAIFEKLWVFAPSSTKSSDGLGPLYNARSCHQCHDLSKKDLTPIPSSLVIHISIEPNSVNTDEKTKENLKLLGFIPEPSYGKQIQTLAYPGAKAEAEVSVSHQSVSITFPDGEQLHLSKPNYIITNPGYGDFHEALKSSPRIAPRMIGLNWLEAIPVDILLNNADPKDVDNDGISGKVNWVWDLITQTSQVGRFGWKASKPSLDQQNLAALSTDIGVSSWLFPKAEGDCSERQSHCTQLARSTETHLVNIQDNKSSNNHLMVEASKEMTDLLLRFTASLAQQKPLPKSNNELTEFESAQRLFNTIGCQSCHISNYEDIVNTYTNDKIPATISPFTDLLLHDMGEALADGRKEFNASGNEWRTAPLWGIAEYLKKSSNPLFLHDGRANSVLEAILWHGGEAEKSKQAFMKLSKDKRLTLIHFVESL
tara:strand:+ start:209 stop:1603 length:1395 start_codon:yes stop_codon:yes gene_type:complete